MKASQHDKEIIDRIMQEEEEFDCATQMVCPNWWHCVGEQSRNGYSIDTYACKQHHAVDVKMVRPYTMDELKNALQKVCEGANAEEWCSVYENRCAFATPADVHSTGNDAPPTGATKGMRKRMDDKLEVAFLTAKSNQKNCLCTCCHGIGRVLKISMPTTLYYGGKPLSTKHAEYWICKSCTEKLLSAISEAADDEG